MNKLTTAVLIFFSSFILSCDDSNKKLPIDFVNPFIGTGAHGHTYPGATVPFGAVQLSPDTRTGNWDACSGYHYSDSSIIGFSHTHLSGTGCIDYGDILFVPALSDAKENKYIQKKIGFSHKNEEASPAYYSVVLDNGIKAELTASKYVGVHRYTFPKNEKAYLVIDLKHLLDNEHIYNAEISQTSDNEIVGMRNTRGWVDNQYIYFVARFSHKISNLDFIKDNSLVENVSTLAGKNLKAIARFADLKDEPLVVKVGLSIVSVENARKNLENDTKDCDFDFDKIHNKSRELWNTELSKIIVKSSNDEQKTNFYTAMYHALIVPNTVSDANGDYRKPDMSTGQCSNTGNQLNTLSLWDTFRAWNPLITVLDTSLVNDIINSMLNIYDVSGELPIWSLSAGETNTMIGYHSVSVIADAYLKGIRGFDAQKALKAMVKSSNINKKGSDFYTKYGFIPSNIKKESVSCLLEFAYDDWCIAQMAKAMGEEEIYKTYIKRAKNYENVFDGNTKFFRGKRLDGNWNSNFNSFEIGRDYTEANAWQYRFFVPHDIYGLSQLFGGFEAFEKGLDDLFTTKNKVEGNLSDITGLIAQYVHGNEPSHHIAFLYNYIGKPWKTQEMTRRILSEMYFATPEGIAGNEDCGQMSAWYILSSLGLYPVCPGSNQFIISTPIWDKAAIKLANGKTLQIKSNNPENNKYINCVILNNDTIRNNFISYTDIMNGGELNFILSDKPNKLRGTNSDNLPYSLSVNKRVSIPYIKQDVNLFENKIAVELGSATANAEIRYTLDGSEPTTKSTLYKDAFTISNTLTIKAKAFKKDYEPSKTFSIKAVKAELVKSVQITNKKQGVNFKYYEGNFHSVNDIEKQTAKAQGFMNEPNIDSAKAEDHFAYIFEAYIYAPKSGVYEFATRSDDGSVLYIYNQKVADNDGSHAAISASGKIALEKGYHKFKLYYFEDYEGQHLSVEWKLPNAKAFSDIESSYFFR